MDIIALARASAAILGVIAALAAVFAGVSSLVGYPVAASDFLLTAMIGGFGAVVLQVSALGGQARSNAREALAVLLLVWAGAPLLAGAPFVSANGEVNYVRAYFHAVSALTTTGFAPGFTVDHAVILNWWWTVLQWLGGLTTLCGALIALSAMNIAGVGVHRSALLTVEPDHLFARLKVVLPPVGAVYAAATGFVALAGVLAGASFGDGLAMAMAAVSTGGLLLPDGQTSAAALSSSVLVAAGLGLVFGAASFALTWELVLGRWRALRDGEMALFAVLVVLVFGAAVAVDLPFTWGETVRVGFEAVALVATAGWDAGPLGVSLLGAPIVLAVVTIGGGALSTAGGVKLRRVLMMLRQVGLELRRLAHPSSVFDSKSDVRPGTDAMFALGVFFIAFITVAAALTLAFAAVGVTLPAAASGAIATLANAGPALASATGAASAPIETTVAGNLVACVGMVLGRIEVVAVFALFTPGFWRR